MYDGNHLGISKTVASNVLARWRLYWNSLVGWFVREWGGAGRASLRVAMAPPCHLICIGTFLVRRESRVQTDLLRVNNNLHEVELITICNLKLMDVLLLYSVVFGLFRAAAAYTETSVASGAVGEDFFLLNCVNVKLILIFFKKKS